MMYRLKVEPQALSDIREISEWYNDKQAGLGLWLEKTGR
jgi:plasmid stabilization system protein ParE